MTQLQPGMRALITTLSANPDLPVIFTQNERAISPGYHITEVKTAVVDSLDCGKGTDQWHELVIQLLDGKADSSNTHMQSATMMSILNQALDTTQVDDSTHLYFEFAPNNVALQKSTVSRIEMVNNTITITLAATSAQCKPFQRALASGKASTGTNGCCGSAPKSEQACCDSGSAVTESSCCT